MSCNSDNGQEQFSFDVGFELSVKDMDGNDLLNPENANSFKASEIKIFYLINGVMEEVYKADKDYPRNFFIYKHENEHRIRVFLNHSETEETPETYIKWNETDTDVLGAKVNQTPFNVKIDNIWLNGNLIWSASENAEPYYAMIK
jgi:hypothetical protein